MERMIELLVYTTSLIISIYGLSALDFNRFIKKNNISRAYVLYLSVAFIMAYLLGKMLLVLIG